MICPFELQCHYGGEGWLKAGRIIRNELWGIKYCCKR